jgi:hypothetical protein
MNVRLFAAVLAIAVAPFVARAADEENPYKKSKVGDFATYKMTTKAMGFNVEGTVTQTVVANDGKEATIEVGGKFMGMDIPKQTQKIDLTKPFDPTKATGPMPAGAAAQVEKLKEGTEKVKVAGKEYDTKWETYKVKMKAGGTDVEADMKVWQAKELTIPVVKMEVSTEFNGQKMEMQMEMTEVGTKELDKKDKDKDKEPEKKKEPDKK